VAVAAVAVRRRTGFLGRAVVAAGMIAALYRAGGINWPQQEMSEECSTETPDQEV
jgi:hypothetical protein